MGKIILSPSAVEVLKKLGYKVPKGMLPEDYKPPPPTRKTNLSEKQILARLDTIAKEVKKAGFSNSGELLKEALELGEELIAVGKRR